MLVDEWWTLEHVPRSIPRSCTRNRSGYACPVTDLLAVMSFKSLVVDQSDAPTMQFALHTEAALTSGLATSIGTAMVDFLNVNAGGTLAPGAYLSSTLDRGSLPHSWKLYDITGQLDGSAHGSPHFTGNFSLVGPSSPNSLPSQTALAITLRARSALSYPVEAPDGSDDNFQVDRPRQRRTGRVYFGPLNYACATSASGTPMRPNGNVRDDLNVSCEKLQDDLNAAGVIWCVWSRTNEAMLGIERIEVDDSFDVIRRRKVKPTARTARVLSPVPSLALGA